jgi:hypothetical protein
MLYINFMYRKNDYNILLIKNIISYAKIFKGSQKLIFKKLKGIFKNF